MKHTILIITFLVASNAFFSMNTVGQNVNIPDPTFKNYLLGHPGINANQDTEIQVAEAEAWPGTINVSGQGITDLTGIEVFTSLNILNCSNNGLVEINLSANAALTELYCSGNGLTELNVFNNLGLIQINCGENALTQLDVSSNLNLQRLDCFDNDLTELDASSNTVLTWLYCYDNSISTLLLPSSGLVLLDCSNNLITGLDVSNTPLAGLYCNNNSLTYLNLRNGTNSSMFFGINAINNPDLNCVEVDNAVWAYDNWITNVDPGVTFNEDCGFTVGIEEPQPQLSLHPNPTTGRFSLLIPSGQNHLNYEIFSPIGQMVQRGVITSERTEITLQDAVAGIYILRVVDDGSKQSLRTSRIVVQ
jgi:hypothetical protein